LGRITSSPGSRRTENRRRRAGDVPEVTMNGDVVTLSIVLTDSLPELDQTEASGVVCLPVLHGLAAGILDASGCVKIRLAHLQMDNFPAETLQFLGLFQHLHDHEGLYVSPSLGRHRSVSSFHSSLFGDTEGTSTIGGR
jgi:hypothetical protein